MYTKKSLIKINHSYKYINDWDVQMANKFVKLIEQSRRDDFPVDGDRVIYRDEWANTYDWALFAGTGTYGDKTYALCENSYTPWVYEGKNGIKTNASGGAWPAIEPEEIKEFKLVKKEKSLFCQWGHGGPQGNGAVQFAAMVNVWQYTKTIVYFNKDLEKDIKKIKKEYRKNHTVIEAPRNVETLDNFIIKTGSRQYTYKLEHERDRDHRRLLIDLK